tara:strand:- start:1592 stop:1843 length:252 start_codon:yes stop_codon:yes gene_type:complete
MIKIYTATWCGPCHSAKSLLKELNLEFDEINIEDENISREQLYKISGNYTVPQIFINGKCIGGYTQLLHLHQNNELNKILNDK